MKKVIPILLILIFLTGCWDKIELEDQAIISAIGVDQIGKEKVKVFLQILNPEALGGASPGGGGGGGGEKKKGVFVVTGTGRTMAEAIEKISTSSPRRLFMGQTKVIIFGGELRKKGITPVLDWIERVYGIRYNALVFTTKEDVNKIMEGKFELGKVSFYTLTRMNLLQTIQTVPFTQTLTKFINNMLLTEHISYAGELGLKGKNLAIKGLGVFQNGVFIQSLNLEQTMDFMRLNNFAHDGIIPLPCPNKKGSYITVRIENEDTTYTTEMKNGKPRLDFEINTVALVESTQCGKRLTEKELKNMEKELNKVMQKRVKSVIKMAQKDLKIDFVGFGDKLKRKNFTAWKEVQENWGTLFPSIESSVKVKSTIRGVEWITDPISANTNEDTK